MDVPENWLTATNKELNDNLEKFDLTEENLTKIMATNKGTILLTAFYKYDPKKHAGLIPVIQVNVRPQNTKNFQQFKTSLINAANDLKSYFGDYEFIQQPTEIEISGIKSVAFTGKFTMKTQDGLEMKARSRTYAIPYKNYFFQINFNDGQFEEDSTELFDKLLKTIKIGSR